MVDAAFMIVASDTNEKENENAFAPCFRYFSKTIQIQILTTGHIMRHQEVLTVEHPYVHVCHTLPVPLCAGPRFRHILYCTY
jgi:hypothetical protein